MTQTIVNLGTGGAVLNGRNGSTTGADSNDAKYLDWTGLNYLYLPGVNGNYLSVPDAAALDITGDIDIRIQMAIDDWTPASAYMLMSKMGTDGNRSFFLYLETGGYLTFLWYTNGTSGASAQATVPTGIVDGAAKYVRATLDVNNGAGGREAKFWTSDDGTTWTQLGATITQSGTTSIFAGPSELTVGTYLVPTSASSLVGKVYCAQLFNGIGGTKVLDIDTNSITSGAATSFTALTGQTVTIARSTTGRKSVAVVSPVWLFGTDDYMEVADNDLIDFGASDSFTVLLIERDWNLAGVAAHVAKVSSLTATTQGWTMRSSGANGALLVTQIGDGTNGINGTTTPARTAGGLSVAAMVRNTATDQLTGYLNGTAGTSGTDTTTGSLANSEALRLGRLSGIGVNYADMELLAVAVFRRALTTTEIAQITAYYQARLS